MQLQRNIRVTRDEAFKAIMEYTHWKANASLVRAFVNRPPTPSIGLRKWELNS